mmetsp:Transcript_29140/g.87114  ORF Transcript_29140/g.87114 Transcript_29140/m.87114 type:complete len:267 (+) Transcript_29140:396-1196(+)
MRSCFAGASAKITPAQRRYEPFLHALARAFPGVFCCLVATRQGEVLARLPLETQHPKNPDFDETEFDDIPVALRKLDDEMTAGDMEFQELVLGIAICHRLSRRYVAEAICREPRRPAAARPPRSPLFQTVGDRCGCWVYGVDAGHMLAFHAEAASYAMDTTAADDRVAPVVEGLREALAGADPARHYPQPWVPAALRRERSGDTRLRTEGLFEKFASGADAVAAGRADEHRPAGLYAAPPRPPARDPRRTLPGLRGFFSSKPKKGR